MFARKRLSRGVTKKNLSGSRDVDQSPVVQVRRKQTYGPNPRLGNRFPKADGATAIDKTIKEYVELTASKGVKGFQDEFKKMASYRAPNDLYKYESFNLNQKRNRYPDVICLESTRVRLTQDVPPSTDYIHANWVKFDKHDRTFIATQAPLENTIDDFWRMVFQERCSSIVNLTHKKEKDSMKSVMYWPEFAGSFKTYDKMFVNTKKIEYENKLPIYTIELVPEGCSDSHVVKMIHMSNWPDKGVPTSGRHVLRLLRMVVANRLDCGPIVVHCSAGIGRTGSIILIDVILRKLFTGEHVDMVELFKELRNQRAWAINNESLYVFVVYSVLDYIRSVAPVDVVNI
ncbi:hypothetical protein RB195_017388 [Necator americanus]|uniref:Protein-tyrosine phosphatase n=1 Tax=Necator americanus TaxID=51031 RepID=A0ABR1C4Z4_NECAM